MSGANAQLHQFIIDLLHIQTFSVFGFSSRSVTSEQTVVFLHLL